MKQKRKHILKKLLIFGIAVMLASCSEELFDEAIESSNKRAIKEVKFNELYKDSKFKNLIEKVSHNSNAARTSFENQNGFTISDGFVKVIETDSVISYTMLIERDVVTDTISFENLVIQENKFNTSEKAYSIKYTPTIIEPSGDDSFYFEGTSELKNLAFTGFNRAGSNENTTESSCYVDVVQVWCSQPYRGSTQHHIAGAGCSISTLYFKTVSVYSPESCDNNSSGTSGAPQGGNGPGNIGGEITSPVKPDQGFGGSASSSSTPCGGLKGVADRTPNLKSKIADFKSPQVLDLDFEKGMVYNDNNINNPLQVDGNPNSTSINFVISGDGSMIIVLHSHFDEPHMLPTFTFEDLMVFNQLYQYRKYNQKPLDKLTLMVVTRAGVFAMRIEDEGAFAANGYNLWTNQNAQLRTKFYENMLAKQNLTDEDVIIEVTKNLANYGVGMYQANADLSSWSKLSVDANNNKVEIPCN
jgi:hypothetical protein